MSPNSEDTIFNGMSNESAKTIAQTVAAPKKKVEMKPWQKVVIGGTSGILIGVGGAIAANVHVPGAEVLPDAAADDAAQDGLRMVAADDSMTFKEAFDAARAEVGPGGAFEWHGNVYGTYTSDEWDSMSAEEHSAFAEQVSAETSEATEPEIDVVDVQNVESVVEADEEVEAVGYDADDSSDVQIVGSDDLFDDETVTTVGEATDGHDVYVVELDDDDIDNAAEGIDDSSFVAEVDAYDAQDSNLTADLGVTDEAVIL